jgi:hypothetical protein
MSVIDRIRVSLRLTLCPRSEIDPKQPVGLLQSGRSCAAVTEHRGIHQKGENDQLFKRERAYAFDQRTASDLRRRASRGGLARCRNRRADSTQPGQATSRYALAAGTGLHAETGRTGDSRLPAESQVAPDLFALAPRASLRWNDRALVKNRSALPLRDARLCYHTNLSERAVSALPPSPGWICNPWRLPRHRIACAVPT